MIRLKKSIGKEEIQMSDHYNGCACCPEADRCPTFNGLEDDACEALLRGEVESARDEYYRAWLEYIGEYE